MPPNLGGFFMVRSYYPSECHADYFDFERIEALKPAIEACGISTLSQSPMLGFHKQMDNRIKLLEEILSFRMQGVEFDNGDMYVDGHKAASDVRDEFEIGRAVQQECRDRDLHSFPTRRSSDLVSRLLNLLLRLVAFLLFLNPQCLASISRWITASSSWKRFCLFVCRALSSIMVICMLTAIRLLLTFVMSLYLLLRS